MGYFLVFSFYLRFVCVAAQVVWLEAQFFTIDHLMLQIFFLLKCKNAHRMCFALFLPLLAHLPFLGPIISFFLCVYVCVCMHIVLLVINFSCILFKAYWHCVWHTQRKHIYLHEQNIFTNAIEKFTTALCGKLH